MNPQGEVLDPTRRGPAALDFEVALQQRLIGQPAALDVAAQMVQTFMAGFNSADRPAGVMLMLGPTGTGKTKLVESLAEVLFGSPRAFFKIACGEYQDSFHVNRLLGAPPGYVGYSDNKADGLLTQRKLDRYQTSHLKLNLVLLDEVEKAHDKLFDLLLNILDKGEVTLSNGAVVDFTKSLVFMTSNLGVAPSSRSIGFSKQELAALNRTNEKRVWAAVKSRFRPEFLNRIDHQVLFTALQPEHLRQILLLELAAIRRRVHRSSKHPRFVFRVTTLAEQALLRLGFDPKFGARHLKRVLEQHVVQPLANIVTSHQILFGDTIHIDHDGTRFVYRRFDGTDVAALNDEDWTSFTSALIPTRDALTMTCA